MNLDEIKKASERYLPQMTKFLRDLIRIPSESCGEEGVIRRTIEEMEALGFDKAEIDPEGNALGWMGDGEKIIAFDVQRISCLAIAFAMYGFCRPCCPII